MKQFRSALAWCCRAVLMSAGATAMASSLVLPTSAQLAGHWQLRQQEHECALNLIEQSNKLDGDLKCAGQWLGEEPATWLPTPDGIWLMNAEGTGIAHLNREKDDEYEGRSNSGTLLVLRRTP